MNPEIDPAVTVLLEQVDELSQWERAELGRTLRRAGWTYTEIAGAVPAAKSTIAGWCSAIVLSDAQIEAIKTRTGSVRGVPRDTQWRRRQERAAIAEEARREARERSNDSYWSAGVVLYWGEGFKTENCLGLANSDDDLVRFFIDWSRRYHDPLMAFRAKLNLHAGNDEQAALAYWCEALALPPSDFNRTFIKPDGTGHRRNHLQHGVIQVRARRSTDHFVRTAGWIDGLRSVWKSPAAPD
jgi:hypothetical protein